MGILQVTGTLLLGQFWPEGESDGDTAHVTIERIQYTSDGKTADVHVFDEAHVTGDQGDKKVVHTDANGVRSFTIRLQGIDAPELHFSASVAKKDQKAPNHPYRQHLGEASAKALHDELKTIFGSATSAPARVVTQVSEPNDVFDVFGRLIGDIIVKRPDGTELNINQWMIEQGWALPTFYVSMTNDEIATLSTRAASAAKAKLGVWKSFSKEIAFEPKLVHKATSPGHPAKVDSDDPGPVLLAKVFRRLVTEYVQTGQTNALHEFLETWMPPDEFIYAADFAKSGLQGKKHALSAVITDAKADFDPADLVFAEAPSTLFDKDGHPITDW
jgi:endonuclease YncB( thermonuclease family)